MYLNRFLENRCSYVRHILRDGPSTKCEQLLRCHVKKMLTNLRKMFTGKCFKLVNNNLPHYFSSFTPQFSAGQQNYNLQNPTMQLPRIKHEFPKQSLRYKLITTLNITPNKTIEVAKTQLQQNLINLARANIVNGYSATCNLLVCNVCTK